MTDSMQALVKTRPGPGNVELREVPVPQVGPLDVLVKVSAASICGTDLNAYDWNRWGRMNIKPPIIFGHEFCGKVVKVGKLVSRVKVGDFVSAETHITCGQCLYCRSEHSYLCPATKIVGVNRDGAFAEFVSLPCQNIWINPPDLPMELATIQEPFGNAAHAALIHDLVGRYVLVTGCGPLGLMTVAIAEASGADRVLATDPVPFRRELAERIGADLVLDPYAPDAVEMVIQATGGQGIDVFLEMSGAPEAIQQGLTLTRPGGRVTLMGIPMEPIEIDLWKEIISKGLIIYGAYGRLAVSRWDRMRSMLHKGTINVLPVITHKFPIQEFKRAFAFVRSGECGKVMLLLESERELPQESVASSDTTTSVVSIDTLPAIITGYPGPDPHLEAERCRLLEQIRDKRLYAIKQEVDSLSDMLQTKQTTLSLYRRRLASPMLPPQQEAFLRSEIPAIEREIDDNARRLDELSAILAQS